VAIVKGGIQRAHAGFFLHSDAKGKFGISCATMVRCRVAISPVGSYAVSGLERKPSFASPRANFDGLRVLFGMVFGDAG
jgi:hypothetical protein